MDMQRKNFIIYAPALSRQSAGNFMLHFLNQALNEIGETSKVVVWGENPGLIADDTIVIYPEVVPGNPLSARCVARYLLNSDGAVCGQKIDRSYKQYLFTYDQRYEKNVPVLAFDLYDLALVDFSDNPETRQLQCVYVGKGNPLSIPFDGTSPYIMFTRSWPEDRELLFNFFKISRFIHLSDPYTALASEALLCGCIPLVADWGDINEDKKRELGFLYEFTYKKDFSYENILFHSQNLRNIIKSRQDAWPRTLKLFVEDIQSFFS